MKQNLQIKGPKISSRTYIQKASKSFQDVVFRRIWLGFLTLTLILTPVAGLLWNPQYNIAHADTAVYGFAKQLGGTGNERGEAITLDSSGNIYTTGSFSGTSDFDPGAGTSNLTSVGQTDIFVSKLDSNGDFVWAKGIGAGAPDAGYSLNLDSSSNVYITGKFYGTVDFDPGAGTFNLTTPNYGTFVFKLDSSGNFVWAKAFAITGESQGNFVNVDSSGNVYTTGWFSGTTDFDPGAGTTNLASSGGSYDIFISKLDTDGNFVWAKRMGSTSSSEGGKSLSIDGDGNVYATGYFSSTADFDPGAGTSNLTSAGNSDIFVSKLDSNGDFVWAKRIGDTGWDYSYSIAIDNAENVFTTGSFAGTVDFDPGAGTSNLTSAGNSDIFVSKLDSSGNFVLAKSIGSTSNDHAYSLTLDSDGNVYTTGYFNGTADFDPGAGTSNLISVGGYDIFVSKLDFNGDFVWAKSFGSSGSEFGGFGIDIDSSNNVYTTGGFYGTADFDPGAGTTNLTSAGGEEMYVSKLTQVYAPTVTSSAASEVNKVEAVLNGNITSTGGEVASERGFEYGLTNSYGTTITQSSGPYSTGAFSESLSGLTCSTVYYFRSYATNSGGTGYGSETTFATSGCTSSGSSSNSSQSNTQTPTDTTQTPTTPTTPTDGTQPTFNVPSSGPSGNPSGGQIRSKEGLLPPSLLFTRNLGIGSVGIDVQRLQQFMNTNGYSVSTTGAGAPNQETTFFGARTRAAVKVFQEAFASEILTPLGLTQGTGYFGNSTRAMLNSLIK